MKTINLKICIALISLAVFAASAPAQYVGNVTCGKPTRNGNVVITLDDGQAELDKHTIRIPILGTDEDTTKARKIKDAIENNTGGDYDASLDGNVVKVQKHVKPRSFDIIIDSNNTGEPDIVTCGGILWNDTWYWRFARWIGLEDNLDSTIVPNNQSFTLAMTNGISATVTGNGIKTVAALQQEITNQFNQQGVYFMEELDSASNRLRYVSQFFQCTLPVDYGLGYSAGYGDYFGGISVEFFHDVPTLYLRSLIEGLYNFSNNMVQDTINISLRSASPPYQITDQLNDFVFPDGSQTLEFENASYGTSYYIVIKQRNSIETWSSGTHSFDSTGRSYDFTTAASQAYGNNLVQVGNKYCIYSGDVNQDGDIDLSDLIMIYNDAGNFISGYVNTDLTGDEYVDLNDLVLAYNNATNFVSVISP